MCHVIKKGVVVTKLNFLGALIKLRKVRTGSSKISCLLWEVSYFLFAAGSLCLKLITKTNQNYNIRRDFNCSDTSKCQFTNDTKSCLGRTRKVFVRQQDAYQPLLLCKTRSLSHTNQFS